MKIIDSTETKEFDAFVSSHPKGHFMQSSLWGKVKNNWKWQGVIATSDSGEIIGTMALLIRKVPLLPYSLMYSPRGPVCDIHDERVIKALIDGAKQVGKKYNAYDLKMDSDVSIEDSAFADIVQKIGFAVNNKSKNFEGIQPRFVFRLPINNRTEEELMASFHSKTRYNIRVAVKNGVEVKICGINEVADFHRIMTETGERDSFGIRTKEYFERMLTSLGEHARLYMAYHEGKSVAGTLAIWYGDKVWYLYGASSNAHRNVMPNYLLQLEMIKWAVEKGCRIYDFRGVSGDLDESNPLYGLYRFKKGFNGDFTEFIGEMDLVLDPVGYKLVGLAQKGYKLTRRTLNKLKGKPHAAAEESSQE